MNAVRQSALEYSEKLELLSNIFTIEDYNFPDESTSPPTHAPSIEPTPPLDVISPSPQNNFRSIPQPSPSGSVSPVSQGFQASSSDSNSSTALSKPWSTQQPQSSLSQQLYPAGSLEPSPHSEMVQSASRYVDYYEPSNGEDTNLDNRPTLSPILAEQLASLRDKWSDRLMKTMYYLKESDVPLKKRLGHQPHMIHSVSFNGIRQNTSSFKIMTTPKFGNCYTLSDTEKFIALRSGPEHGLKIVVNVEIDEYVDSFIASYGVKVVLHEPGTLPLPYEEGFILNPATETSVGLKLLSLGETPRALRTLYGWTLVRGCACLSLCRARRIISVCSCIPLDSPDVELNTTVLPVCSSVPTSVDNLCTDDVDLMFNEEHSSCKCDNPCSESIYGKTISSRTWPGDSYMKELLMDICKDDLPSMQQPCAQLRNHALNTARYRQNFLQILIYYEDLNYERISQEPMYEPVRFVSDIGGAFGLFLGASALSFVEFLQLLMEICLFLYHKGRERLGPKETSLARTTLDVFRQKQRTTSVSPVKNNDD